MDSISQIVLGAAVGEAYLGRKIGNRAMLWGAIAGTIPDLDVVSNLWMDKIDSMAFHRGISHSLFFSIIAAGLLAYTVHRFYQGYYRKRSHRKRTALVVDLLLTTATIAITGVALAAKVGYGLVVGPIVITIALLLRRRLHRHYVQGNPIDVQVPLWQWYVFFFLTLFTHPLLDCCTAYGTQLWAPFSTMRVAWNIISVADPLWTAPFGLALVIAALQPHHSRWRTLWLVLGVSWASLYMGWCISNKAKVDQVMKDTIEAMDLKATRFITGPTILNNILWSGTVETDSLYYQGLYSLKDREARFKLTPIAKNHERLADAQGDHVVETLKWFSKGYYNVIKRKDGRLQVNDLRYGSTRSAGAAGEDDFIFRFVLEPNGQGGYALDDAEGGPPKGREKNMMLDLIARIKGI